MKQLFSVMIIFLMLLGCACADKITIDTESASVEEMVNAVKILNKAIMNKTADSDTLPKVAAFSNGITATIKSYRVMGDRVYVTFGFSHQNKEPQNAGTNLICLGYQHGNELERGHEDYSQVIKTVLAGGETEFTMYFVMVDDSEVVIYIRPMTGYLSNDDDYVYFKIKVAPM